MRIILKYLEVITQILCGVIFLGTEDVKKGYVTLFGFIVVDKKKDSRSTSAILPEGWVVRWE